MQGEGAPVVLAVRRCGVVEVEVEGRAVEVGEVTPQELAAMVTTIRSVGSRIMM